MSVRRVMQLGEIARAARRPNDLARRLWADAERFAQVSTAVSGMLAYGLSVLSGPILSRSLAATGRGELAAVVGSTQLIGYALLLGLPLAAMYHASDHPHRDLISNSWTVALIVGVPVTVLFWVIAPWYLRDHSAGSVAWFRAFLVSSVIFVPSSVSLELLRTRVRMVAFNVLRNLPLVLNTVFLVLLWILGRVTLTTALAAQLTALGISFISVFAVGGFAWAPRRTKKRVMWGQVRYGLQVWLGSLSSLIINRIDQFLLVGLATPAELGHYVVAVTGSSVSGPIGVAFGLTLFPKVRDAADSETRRAATSKALWMVAAASGAITLLVAVAAPFIIPFVFGKDFTASVGLLWILLPGQFMADLASVMTQNFMAAGQPGIGSQGLGLAAVVTVVGLLILVGPFGVAGAAISTTLAEVALMGYLAIRYWMTQRSGRESEPSVV